MADNIEAVAEWLYNYAVKLSGRPDWYDSWAECREEIKEDFRRDARQIDALYQEGSPMYLDKDGQWKMKAQPDDLLLSDEEIHKLAEEVIQDNAIEAFEFAKKLAKAQHAKDQKRIEQVFEFLYKYQVIRPDKDSISQFDPFISIPVTDIWELKAKIKEE